MYNEKIFGTDGIRRKVSDFSIEFLIHLGQAVGNWLYRNDQKVTVFIGRDTRRSGEMIEAALTTGLLSQGVNVTSLGVIPTSGVAYLTKKTEAKLGIMLSGSHNTAVDNGIKFFKEDGFKMSEAAEEEIEGILRAKSDYPVVEYNMLGKLESGIEYFDDYVNYLLASWKGNRDLSNYKIVVDCVNGATYQMGPKIFSRLGAEVIVLNDQPNGMNINPDYDSEIYESHKPMKARTLVAQEKANLGIGFDGDGDRVLLVDEQGNYLDGDHMLAIRAQDMKKRNSLAGNTVVTTIMRNLGLDMTFQNMGIDLEVTSVGDKYVAARMLQNKYILGGEQAGHILIFEDGQTTGDGIYVALRIAALLADSGQPLSDFTSLVSQYPQKIEHVRNVPASESIDEIPGLVEQIKESETLLARSGPHFINVRYSGTEKGLVRITVKGIIQAEIEQQASNIARVIENWKQSIVDCK